MTNGKLSMSSKCVKYLMFMFNFLFVITGIILLSIGSYIHGAYTEYHHFLDDNYFSVPTLLVVIGSIIFFVAFFGCCGAIKENYCMIVAFAVLMVIIFILELSGAICGYVLRSKAQDVISTKMQHSMIEYKPNNADEITVVWDVLQTKFHCCGTEKPEEWLKILNTTSSSDLPLSCCQIPYGAIGHAECNTQITNSTGITGCLNTITDSVKQNAVELGGVALTIAVIQTLGIWFSVYLARSIRKNYIFM